MRCRTNSYLMSQENDGKTRTQVTHCTFKGSILRHFEKTPTASRAHAQNTNNLRPDDEGEHGAPRVAKRPCQVKRP